MSDVIGDGTEIPGVVVARRPVVDRDRHIVGFELVYRSHAVEDEPGEPGTASGVVAVHQLLRAHGTSIDDVVGDRRAICHVDRDLFVGDYPLMLKPRRTVLLVPGEDPGDDLVAACRVRKSEGYTLAVENLTWVDGVERLLSLVDIVKIDVGQGAWSAGQELAERCRSATVELLAHGCDTEAELAWARDARFTLFQGEAVQSPPVEEGASIAPSALTQVQLGIQLLTDDLELDAIEDILRGEPGLAAQVLNLASLGASKGLRRQIRSLREALVRLGTVKLRQWAALTILGRHRKVDSDALLTGLVRARMCELLADSQRVDRAFAFTAGLLSTLDLVLGVELEEVERRLSFDADLVAAAFRRQGPVGELIAEIATHQQLVRAGREPGLELAHLHTVGAQAFAWGTRFMTAMEAPTGPAAHPRAVSGR